MAASGFEGFEKRLELHFSGDDPMSYLGLRLLDFESLERVLNAVQCTVVSAVGNLYLDAYVLSESSLFVYPSKVIIKTCGTTQLLQSVRPLLRCARRLGLSLSCCRFTRGSFIFPASQPYPHTSFEDEVLYLEATLPPALCFRKASKMPSKTAAHSWHVFTASDSEYADADATCTLEVCMTELDRGLARGFFGGTGKEMTRLTGIGEINPAALTCDFAFDPCGYSMNGIHGDRYSTIHVTPEDAFSYASFECVGDHDLAKMLKRVLQVFRPGALSVATTCAAHEGLAGALEPMGWKRRSCAVDQFPALGNVVFQTFTARR